MGAMYGKSRFKCQGCPKTFSWRLDLEQHSTSCKGISSRRGWSTPDEHFLLELCFLCGCQLSGVQSEESSFVKGLQKLYHSKRPFIQVLEMITNDSAVRSLQHCTIGLCKVCMNSVNKWDETQLELQAIGKSLCGSYRYTHKKGKRTSVKRKKTSEQVDRKFEDESDVEDTEGEEMGNSARTDHLKKENPSKFAHKSDQFKECEDKEYTCECGKVIQGLSLFVEHQLREGCKMKTNEYSCKYCGTVFSEKKLLVVHKKACIEASLVNGAHECDICGRRFLVRGRVETHKRNVHSIGTADQQLCSYCGRTFGNNYNMKNHLAREHGIGQMEIVVCELCGGKFSDRASLRNHMKNIHGERKYECATCGKKFATPGIRNHHINELHNNIYNYECNICGEQFHISFKYRYHMRKMHNTLQYSCDDCGRTFIMRSDLYRHVRGVHMGIRDPKRYPCKVCGRLFPSMYKVKRHMSSHGYLSSKTDKSILEQHVATLDTPTTTSAQTTDAATALVQPTDINDGTSIDVHQLQVSEIYADQHITTLTPEILQGGPDIVGAETMVVGSMSGIVVSASTISDSINAELQHPPPQHQQTQLQHHQQVPQQSSEQFRSNSSVLQQPIAQTIMPVHQMIVIHDSVNVPGHADFTVATSNSQVLSATTNDQVLSISQSNNQVTSVPQSSNQVLSVPSDSEQVIAISQSSGQVLSAPSVNTQVMSAPLHSKGNFALPITQQPSQTHSQPKLTTIHYQYFPS